MKRTGRRILSGILILTFLATFIIPNIYAQEGGRGGNTGSAQAGGGSTGSCKPEYDKYGGCYSPNGPFWWIKVPATSDSMAFSSLGFAYLRKEVRNMSILNCKTGGGYAYVLVTNMYDSHGNSLGLGAGIPLNEAWNHLSTGGGGGIGESVSPEGAQGKFNEHQDFYKNEWGQEYSSGSGLTYFCADPETTTTTTTTTTTPPRWYDGCFADRTREMGDTKTRIAVRNRTLDDPVANYHHNWKPANGGSLRYSLPNDSGWTDSGGEYFTIAKPGDSVQFLHAFCAGARYVRKVDPMGVHWISERGHTEILPMETNYFRIGAIPDFYLFGDGISWVNGEAASVPEYGPPQDQYPFPNNPPHNNGIYVSADRFGLGVLSPTTNNNGYECNGVSMYASWGVPYISGASFQIPGYDSGWSCSAANRTQSNTVGKEITQYHEFNSIKAWEQWTHTRSGRCGCNSEHSAVLHGNYFSPEYGKIGSEWGERHQWQCNPTPDCMECCECVAWSEPDQYGNTWCTDWDWDSWSNTHESYEMQYYSRYKNYGDQRKVAKVYVPYNYETSTTSAISANDVVYQGGSVSSSFTWDVLKRPNPFLASFDFATVTPPDTRVQLIEFISTPDDQHVSGSIMSPVDPCAYYAGHAPDEETGTPLCTVIREINGNQNPEGYYDGKHNSASATRVVPDNGEYIGYKYCVAVGFWPADSHDYISGDLSSQYRYGRGSFDGSAMDAGDYWNISGASCRTIAKKPSVQVWNGSTYTEGNVTTSVSKKIVNAHLGSDYDGSATTLFGSWTDYSISAMGDVRGMASGAVLGFDDNRYDLAGGGEPTSTMNMRRMSPLTVANSADAVGRSGVNASASIDVNLNRLNSRYSEKAKTFAKKDPDLTSQASIRTAETGMQYVYYEGNVALSTLSNNIRTYASSGHPNQTTHRNGDGGIYKTLGDGINDNTLVIYVTGKITIDGNICLGSGCHGAGMELIDYKYGTETNAAAKLPQILIFAKDIEIDQKVSRIDAWLVAPEGNVNTCKDYKIGSSLAAHDAYNRYGAGSCYKTLMVNGPVYAKDLTLNRTAGATHGAAPTTGADVLYRQYGATGADNDGHLGAQTPAEIFNLRADVYLWAYNQAQRYSEAVVTYMRELAPRY